MAELEVRNKTHISQSYVLLRVGIGLSFAIHGASLFGNTAIYHNYMSEASESSVIQLSTFFFAYFLMGLEILTGLMLAVGFKRQLALVLLCISTILFLVASILTEAWQSFTIVLVFLFSLYWLLRNLDEDRMSFDGFLKL